MHIGHVIAFQDIRRFRIKLGRRHDLARAVNNPVIAWNSL